MLITAVMSHAALAAETTSPNPERKTFSDFWEEALNAPERIVGDTVSIQPSSPYYSAAVAGTGAQGRVILLLDLSKDGRVKSARVHTSSRSDTLDAAAIRKALTMSYQGRGAAPKTVSGALYQSTALQVHGCVSAANAIKARSGTGLEVAVGGSSTDVVA